MRRVVAAQVPWVSKWSTSNSSTLGPKRWAGGTKVEIPTKASTTTAAPAASPAASPSAAVHEDAEPDLFQSIGGDMQGVMGGTSFVGFEDPNAKPFASAEMSDRPPCEGDNPPPEAVAAAAKVGDTLGAGGSASTSSGPSSLFDRRKKIPTPPPPPPTGGSRCEAHPRNHVDPQEEKELTAKQLRKETPYQDMNKEQMWGKIREANRAQAMEELRVTRSPTGVDYYKIESDLKEDDMFHWRLGQVAIDDVQKRKDYYALQAISLGLNKSRWKHIETPKQKGMGTMGANMRTMFWKESIYSVVNQGQMPSGQFVEGHPVLRPFADMVMRNPQLTKTFLRGFTDARLKIVNQPGNMKQLLDLFDKSYGFFFATQLELLGIRDEHAEHVVSHIGRAVGLTQHAVLLWRKYAEHGVTMFPAEICADNHVSLGLLKHQHLAKTDRGVRKTIYDIMCQVKAEMNHVRDLMPLYPTQGWPLLFEAFLPNYYLGFLQKHDFDVSKWYVEDKIHGPGFLWYAYKKNLNWRLSGQLEDLVKEEAPLPGLSAFWRKKSKYAEKEIDCPR